MGLKETLYQGGEIPKGTNLDKIQQLREHLADKLFNEEMHKTHIWLAACTVAVVAGNWKGERFRERRLKLLSLINKCCVFLGEEEISLPKGWEMLGLYYGYGAHHNFSRDSNISIEKSVVLGNFNSLFSKVQRRGDPIDTERLLRIASYAALDQMPEEPEEGEETIH